MNISIYRPESSALTVGCERLDIDPTDCITVFTVGKTYYGSLLCEHTPNMCECVKRTAKSIWFKTWSGEVRRSKIKWYEGCEWTENDGYLFSADSALMPNTDDQGRAC